MVVISFFGLIFMIFINHMFIYWIFIDDLDPPSKSQVHNRGRGGTDRHSILELPKKDKFVLDIGSLNNSDSESLCEVADNRETYIITCLICVFILKRLWLIL